MLANIALIISVASYCLGQQIAPTIIKPINGTCPSAQSGEEIRNNIQQEVSSLLQNIITQETRFQCPCGGSGEWTRMAYLNTSDPNKNALPTGVSSLHLQEVVVDQLPLVGHVILPSSHQTIHRTHMCVEE